MSQSKRPPSLSDALKEAHAIAGGNAGRLSSAPPAPVQTGRKAVLIVDDDPLARAALAKLLSPKYDVHECVDGLAAAERAAVIPNLALIVSDVAMPRMDGFALTRLLKGHPLLKRIPVVFITSRTGPTDMMQALTLGVRHVFPKPIKESEIVAKLEKMMA